LPFIILIICGYSFVYYSLFKFKGDYAPWFVVSLLIIYFVACGLFAVSIKNRNVMNKSQKEW